MLKPSTSFGYIPKKKLPKWEEKNLSWYELNWGLSCKLIKKLNFRRLDSLLINQIQCYSSPNKSSYYYNYFLM